MTCPERIRLSSKVVAALGPVPDMAVRSLIPDLRAGRLASVSLPYDAIKDWSAVEGLDFVDGTERIEFLIAGMDSGG